MSDVQKNLEACMHRIVELEKHLLIVNQKLVEASSSKQLKLPLPIPYDGDPYKIDDWTFCLENFFNLAKVDADSVKVDYCVSLLQGTALSWWRHVSPKPSTYHDFKEALLSQFKVDDEGRLARDLLAFANQRGHVHIYTKYFRSLLLKIPDMTEAEARDRYIRGLKPEIRKEVLLRDCRSLNDTIKVAERYDLISSSQGSHPIIPNFQSTPQSRPAFHAPQVDPNNHMDVDSVLESKEEFNLAAASVKPSSYSSSSQPQTHRRKLTDVERRELSRNRACFYCREKGHMKRDCPKRPSSGNGV